MVNIDKKSKNNILERTKSTHDRPSKATTSEPTYPTHLNPKFKCCKCRLGLFRYMFALLKGPQMRVTVLFPRTIAAIRPSQARYAYPWDSKLSAKQRITASARSLRCACRARRHAGGSCAAGRSAKRNAKRISLASPPFTHHPSSFQHQLPTPSSV